MEQSAAFKVGVNESRVKVSGELDVLTSPSMIDAVLEATTSTLDLSEVTFIDARGLTALLRLRRSRPEVEIISVSPCVQHLLDMTDTVDQLQVGARIPAVA